MKIKKNDKVLVVGSYKKATKEETSEGVVIGFNTFLETKHANVTLTSGHTRLIKFTDLQIQN